MKRCVLVRMLNGKLFVLGRDKYAEFEALGEMFAEYKGEVIAESDSFAELMRFKELVKED